MNSTSFSISQVAPTDFEEHILLYMCLWDVIIFEGVRALPLKDQGAMKYILYG